MANDRLRDALMTARVTHEELEAIPWANNGRDGVAYRAAAIHPAAQARAA